jgi:hypothetical protein
MDGEPALAMTVARRCRWVNTKGDWYYVALASRFSNQPAARFGPVRLTGNKGTNRADMSEIFTHAVMVTKSLHFFEL